MKKFVCQVCGYVYEGEAAPAKCPQCGAPASKFQEMAAEMGWAAEHVVGIASDVPEDIKADLDRENIPYDKNISVGVMIETPAASEIADLLAKEADFFSIGTNDLTQYTMAVDRGNSKVAYLYSVYNPAVIRSIKRIISAAANENIIAGMCGEAAADPLLTPLLISFGLKEFSVNASSILRTRAQIAKWTKTEADKVADEVMKCATQEEVYEILKRYQR